MPAALATSLDRCALFARTAWPVDRRSAPPSASGASVHIGAHPADPWGVTEHIDDPAPTARAAVWTGLAAGVVYLGWRAGWTRSGTDAWLFWPLWLAEATTLLSLVRFAAETWRLRFDQPVSPERQHTVDVVVIARDEPTEVLRATLIGCVALQHEHRTVVLDPLCRQQVADLARSLGIEVMCPRGLDASAEPEVHLNSVLDRLDGELIAVLRGDDVPLPEMIGALQGDFADETVWCAQGRQAVYGPSAGDYDGGIDELALFFGVMQPGKNHHGAAYWCGSGALLRREAVDALGGVPVQTDTPTFQMSLAAHADGWTSTFHGEPTALTLAQADVEGFVARHALWAAGNIQSLRTPSSPLFPGGLSRGQRLSYLGTIATYLAGPRRLASVAVLVATLLTGRLPIVTDPWMLVAAWALWMALFTLARRRLARGLSPELGRSQDHWLLMGAYTTAWLGLAVPRSVSASLRTPPPTAGHRHLRPRIRARLLVTSGASIALAALVRAVSAAGPSFLPELPTAATTVSLAAALALCATIGGVLLRAARRTRRGRPRFAVESTARVGGVTVDLLEVSERGASVRMPSAPRIGCPFVVGLRIPGLDGTVHQATVAAEVRAVRPTPPPDIGHIVGLSFTHLSATARDRLAEYCRVLLPARNAAVALDDGPMPRSGKTAPNSLASDTGADDLGSAGRAG